MSGLTNAVVREMKARTAAALTNEQLTRKRVDALEEWAATFSGMTLKQRLLWLLRGK